MRRYKKQISRIVTVAMLFAFLVGNSNMVYAMGATQVGYASKYITVKGNNMHLALYGKLDASGETFADEGKTTLVMMPALGVPSPHIYFKPLAQSLDESFNIVIVEPFGYGLSDVAATDRTVDNINSELNAALDTMGIKQCVLLVHSISGVYNMMIELYASMAQAEMEKKEKRQKEGMEAKRLRGEWDEVGRPRAIEQEKFNQEFMRVVQKKVTPTQLQRELGLTSSTYYRYRKNFYENFPEFLQSV